MDKNILPARYREKLIKEAALIDYSGLYIVFDDNTTIYIYDTAHYCCAHRYVSTDDTPSDLIGKKLTSLVIKNIDVGGSDYIQHDMVFVEVRAEEESIVLVTHNEHNGYYGGFELSIRDSDKNNYLLDCSFT